MSICSVPERPEYGRCSLELPPLSPVLLPLSVISFIHIKESTLYRVPVR